MKASKFVALLSWTSLFALEWLAILGKVEWNAQTIGAFALFFVVGLISGLTQFNEFPKK